MKHKAISLFLVCAGVGVWVGDASAQTKKKDSDEAVRSTGIAERRLDNMAFRMTLRTEWFTERDGEVFRETVETFTAAPPDRYQHINEDRGNRTETIVVADRTFRRINDSDWESVAVPSIKKVGSPETVAMFGELAGGAVLPRGTGKFVTKGTIGAVEVSLYEVLQVRKDRTEDGGGRTELTRYYINSDGLIVRRVIEHEFTGDTRFMRSTADYTYENIRIEEPTIPNPVRNK
jgi:hypothetical protein